MPREHRQRSTIHEPSVKIAKRHFAVQEQEVEHVDVGAAVEASGNDILLSITEEDSRPSITKKEKQQLKRQALIQKLQSSLSPYSKAQRRRFKRKQEEQVGGGLDDIEAVISSMESDNKPDASKPASKFPSDRQAEHPRTKTKAPTGRIGEGKGAPLTKAQRQRALEMERLRHPLIVSNPDYVSNPFQTIRIHAQNTMVKHEALAP